MGFLSKIFKPFKKIVRGIGRGIKGIAKIITKPLKAILKPIGKIFGKLGPIGTIALGFLLPGIGSALGSWFNAAGGAFQGLFEVGSFMHNTIGSIGTAIQGAAKWGGDMYGKTVGRVFDTIGGALKGGVDALTGGSATKFGAWTEKFMGNLSYKGDVGIKAPTWGADAAAQSSWTDKIYEAAGNARDYIREGFEATTTPRIDRPISVSNIDTVGDSKGLVSRAMNWGESKISSLKAIDTPLGSLGDIQEAKSIYDSATAEDPKMRFGGQQSSAISTGLLSGVNTASFLPSFEANMNIFNNAPNFMDLMQKYAGVFNSTIPSHLNPYQQTMNMPGYGWDIGDVAAKFGGGGR
jgi:hypothetical protein